MNPGGANSPSARTVIAKRARIRRGGATEDRQQHRYEQALVGVASKVGQFAGDVYQSARWIECLPVVPLQL